MGIDGTVCYRPCQRGIQVMQSPQNICAVNPYLCRMVPANLPKEPYVGTLVYEVNRRGCTCPKEKHHKRSKESKRRSRRRKRRGTKVHRKRRKSDEEEEEDNDEDEEKARLVYENRERAKFVTRCCQRLLLTPCPSAGSCSEDLDGGDPTNFFIKCKCCPAAKCSKDAKENRRHCKRAVESTRPHGGKIPCNCRNCRYKAQQDYGRGNIQLCCCQTERYTRGYGDKPRHPSPCSDAPPNRRNSTPQIPSCRGVINSLNQNAAKPCQPPANPNVSGQNIQSNAQENAIQQPPQFNPPSAIIPDHQPMEGPQSSYQSHTMRQTCCPQQEPTNPSALRSIVDSRVDYQNSVQEIPADEKVNSQCISNFPSIQVKPRKMSTGIDSQIYEQGGNLSNNTYQVRGSELENFIGGHICLPSEIFEHKKGNEGVICFPMTLHNAPTNCPCLRGGNECGIRPVEKLKHSTQRSPSIAFRERNSDIGNFDGMAVEDSATLIRSKIVSKKQFPNLETEVHRQSAPKHPWRLDDGVRRPRTYKRPSMKPQPKWNLKLDHNYETELLEAVSRVTRRHLKRTQELASSMILEDDRPTTGSFRNIRIPSQFELTTERKIRSRLDRKDSRRLIDAPGNSKTLEANQTVEERRKAKPRF